MFQNKRRAAGPRPFGIAAGPLIGRGAILGLLSERARIAGLSGEELAEFEARIAATDTEELRAALKSERLEAFK